MKAFIATLCLFVFASTSSHAQDTLFDSQHPVLKLTMKYPLSWKLSVVEGKGEKYSAYELAGPENPSQSYRAHINVAVASPTDVGFKTPQEYFEAYLDKMKTLSCRAENLKRGTISYWGEMVPYIDITYSLPLPMNSATYTWTPIRERKYAIVHAGMFWTFSLAAEASEYEAQDKTFESLMDTFFFK